MNELNWIAEGRKLLGVEENANTSKVIAMWRDGFEAIGQLHRWQHAVVRRLRRRLSRSCRSRQPYPQNVPYGSLVGKSWHSALQACLWLRGRLLSRRRWSCGLRRRQGQSRQPDGAGRQPKQPSVHQTFQQSPCVGISLVWKDWRTCRRAV